MRLLAALGQPTLAPEGGVVHLAALGLATAGAPAHLPHGSGCGPQFGASRAGTVVPHDFWPRGEFVATERAAHLPVSECADRAAVGGRAIVGLQFGDEGALKAASRVAPASARLGAADKLDAARACRVVLGCHRRLLGKHGHNIALPLALVKGKATQPYDSRKSLKGSA